MPYLEINSLKLKNIRCFDDISIDFEKGANIITGANGSGKSTILTGIGYGLFGSNYISINIADLIKRGEQSGKIELHFSTDRGKFKSIHYLNPDKRNSWKVYRSDINTPMTETITESQEYIQSLLGTHIDHSVFKNAIASRQGDITALLDLQPAKRQEQIRRILGLDYFDVSGIHLGKFANSIQNELDKTRSNIEILQGRRKDPEEIAEKLSELETKLEKQTQEMQVLETEKNDLEDEVASLRKLETKINLEKNELKNKRIDLNQKEEELSQFSKVVAELVEELNEEPKSIEITKQRISAETSELERLNSNLQDIKIDLTTLREHKQQLEQRKKKHQTLEKNLNRTNKILDNVTSELSLDQIIDRIEKLTTEIDTYSSKMEDLKTRLQDISHRINQEESKIEQTMTKIENLKRRCKEDFGIPLSELDQLLNLTLQNREKLETKLIEIQEELQENQSSISKIEQQREMTQQTIELIGKSDPDAQCPICHRDFEDLATETLITHHEDTLTNLNERLKEEIDLLQQKRTVEENFSQKIAELQRKQLELERFSVKADMVPQWTGSLDEMNENVVNLKKIRTEISEEVTQLEERNIDEIKSRKVNLVKQRERILELQQQQQKLSASIRLIEEQKQEIEEKIKGKDEAVLDEQFNTKVGEKNVLENRLSLRRDRLLPKLRERHNANEERINLQSDIQRIGEKLSEYKEIFDPKVLERKSQALQDMIQYYGELKASINGLTEEMIPETKTQLDEARLEEQQLEQLVSEQNELERIHPLVKRMRGIIEATPSRIIDKISTNLSSRLTQTVQRLLPNRGYTRVEFHPDGGLSLYNDGQKVENSTLSGGERTVLGLAMRLALADYIAPLQFLILDEPTNHLDRERVREFVEIVDRENIFQTSTGQLLLVTHRQEFDRNADNSVRLIIEDGKRIVET